MKIKKSLTFILCICVIVLVICFCGQFRRTTYEFTPKASLAFFSTEPEEFFDTYYDYYDSCEDFRKHAEINENGFYNYIIQEGVVTEVIPYLKNEERNIKFWRWLYSLWSLYCHKPNART